VRTTLDIEDDVLAAARELARRQGMSAGQMVSRLLRTALSGGTTSGPASAASGSAVAGFRPFPAQAGQVVTDEQVDRLRDEGHVSHRAASRWLERELDHGWATCPITENGLVRIMAQPAYPNPNPLPRWPPGWPRPAAIPAIRSGGNPGRPFRHL